MWRLETKSLWWDESLSLQRAESPLSALVLGQFVFDDGIVRTSSIDQHPFVYFVGLGALIRLAGQSDFVLRFPSVAAATLLVPAMWTLACLLVRRGVLPASAPSWAVLLAAVNPFYLWYGREVRMYSLVPFLALVSSYLLLRWGEVASRSTARRYLVGYVVALGLLLCTHYLTILILPIHAFLFFTYLAAHSRRRAILVAAGLLAGGLAFGVVIGSLIVKGPGGGTNFARVSLQVMLLDLLNVFSLGLSVDVTRVRWLDYIFAACAVLGGLWSVRPGRPVAREAWFLPMFLLVPVSALQIFQYVQPAYMNARHLSLISGAFVLLVAGGVAVIWQFRRWVGAGLTVMLLAGAVYSTINYFYSPRYAKDDFAALGTELRGDIQPGDGLVMVPSHMIRLYRHYLPVDLIEQATLARTARSAEPQRGWQALPQLDAPLETTEKRLQAMLGQYRRIWLVDSGMVPLSPFQEETRAWLSSHAFLVRDSGYESNTSLSLKLYLPQPPVLTELPGTVQHPVAAVFGEKICLCGYDLGQSLSEESVMPITLYWQPLQPMERRYKYILRLVIQDNTGSFLTLSTTEREPYHGTLPTTLWGLGQTIVEYSDVPQASRNREEGPASPVRLVLQMYDAETLEKLPITRADRGEIAADGRTLVLPYAP